MAVEAVATRRRIIPRPRLTKLLDDSPARIKLLIAPAGYGKTTLAQQWLAEGGRVGLWYRAGPAAADVAALAAGLSETIGSAVPDAGARMRERILTAANPEEEVDVMAELLADDLVSWPRSTWLAIDDYHFAVESSASERFVDLLTRLSPIQLVVASRDRPSWGTARRILYGEILEVDQRTLAMDDDEALRLLGRPRAEVQPVLDEARGWPAVLGLAALTGERPSGRHHQATLEQFFSQELLSGLTPHELEGLSALSLARTFTRATARLIVGDESESVLESGLRIGLVLNDGTDSYFVHPLPREYLLRTADDEARQKQASHAERLLYAYVDQARWDDAFELVRYETLERLLPFLIGAALDPLLTEGRLATLSRWLDYAYEKRVVDPLLLLAEAEVAFRLSDPTTAEKLAAEAAAIFKDPRLVTRSFLRAGYSAVLASREETALSYFRRAGETATSVADRREALAGEYYTASELGNPAAASALEAAHELHDSSPEGVLRLEVMRLTQANRKGGLREAVARSAAIEHLLNRVGDPLASTAFLHAYATSLNLSGRYAEALEKAHRLLTEAESHGLELPIPHGQLDMAVAQLGLKRYAVASRLLSHVRDTAARIDRYLEAIAIIVRARLLLSRQRADQALVELGSVASEPLGLSTRSEVESLRALAFARLGRAAEARRAIDQAVVDIHTSVEAGVFVAGARAVSAKAGSAARADLAQGLWDLSEKTGNVDGFVCTYRTDPRIVLDVAKGLGRSESLLSLMERVGDLPLARRLGLSSTDHNVLLTRRESEVAELLSHGLSNKQIADQLFISGATVKVHLRHIYEKLDVRTRAEAIARLR